MTEPMQKPLPRTAKEILAQRPFSALSESERKSYAQARRREIKALGDRIAENLNRNVMAEDREDARGALRPQARHTGSCHCGAVRFAISTDFPELTTCDCTICRRKNALMVRVHESAFELISGEDSLTEYQFHTYTARHFFCKVCGIYPFHRKRVTPDHFGVNVFCLDNFDPEGIPVRATDGKGMA